MTDELYHYGVKGMKWGIRRTPANLGHKTKAADSEQKRQRKSDLKNRRRLSDKDLDQKIERLKKEKQFKELSESDIAPGRTAVKKFLKSNGGKVLSNAAVGAFTYAGYVALTGNVDPRQAAGYIFPNPKKK
jgi:hypothetical protein